MRGSPGLGASGSRSEDLVQEGADAGIARALNDQHVPCSSGVDLGRNPHRAGQAWGVLTVASVLANPRYTGRQVRNRQQTRRVTSDEDSQLLVCGWVCGELVTQVVADAVEFDMAVAAARRRRRAVSRRGRCRCAR
ncbi:recombinase family protein [Saccharopolyspora shandongensis]|uniref:recombinase family protein n=1 Tax=Saccharopolyspora shandongensis TaxID=418495 RepID=UPI0033D715C5